jgi:hypothetical protein
MIIWCFWVVVELMIVELKLGLLKVVFKGLIYRGFLVGNQVFLISFNQRDKIPLIMGWLCMFLGFGFQEITAMPPSRHRAIILVES